MSSVFISNVDDYLAPSQACVNPLFSDSVNHNKSETAAATTDTTSDTTSDTTTDTTTDTTSGVVTMTLPRRKLGQRGKRPLIPIPIKTEPAKVSLADCLACSGCITTAETVLVEQHSLATLYTLLLANNTNNTNNHSTDGTQQPQQQKQQQICMTLSPASLADLFRHCQIDTQHILRTKRQLVTFLSNTCQATMVMDGQVPLQWSLQEASREFVHTYHTNHAPQTKSDKPTPSIHAPIEPNHPWPLLSATCPALVCLVETSHAKAVPHLASTKSPMTMAGAFFKHIYHADTSRPPICHIAIMPCHDKKLEASRKDFTSIDNHNHNDISIPDVDLVLTTQELVQLLHETCGSTNISDVRLYLEQLDEAPMIDSVLFLENTRNVTFASSATTSTSAVLIVLPSDNNEQGYHPNTNDFYPYSSGGYADFIFQYACQELFGHTIPSGHVPWTPVEQTQRQSARVANHRPRNHYQVSLFRHATDDFYSCIPSTETFQPVLSFAIAYGRQAMQRILLQQQHVKSYDYVELMACPSGCLNGGGQLRLSDREAPSETRLRVIASQAMMTMEPSRSMAKPISVDSDSITPFGMDQHHRMHTQYHVVPKLQFNMGVTAGVAVQDTHW